VSCLVIALKKFRMDFVARLGAAETYRISAPGRNGVSRRFSTAKLVKTPESFNGNGETAH
jgi:hypothetical protein